MDVRGEKAKFGVSTKKSSAGVIFVFVYEYFDYIVCSHQNARPHFVLVLVTRSLLFAFHWQFSFSFAEN